MIHCKMISQSTAAILLLAVGGYYLHSETEEVRQMIARNKKPVKNTLTGKTCNFEAKLSKSLRGNEYGNLLADRAQCINDTDFVLCGNPVVKKGKVSYVWSVAQSCPGKCHDLLSLDTVTDPYRIFHYKTVVCSGTPKSQPIPEKDYQGVEVPPAKPQSCDFAKEVARCTSDKKGVKLCGFNEKGTGFNWYPPSGCGVGTECREFTVSGKVTAICDFPQKS